MKIAILTLGTRGDVQPYAVLGKALKERKHEVVLSAAKDFESFIKSYGLDFVPVDADFQAMVNSKERNKIKNKPWLAKKYMDEFVNPMMKDALSKFYNVPRECDKVLFHNKTMADNFADQFPDKMIRADIIPLNDPTSAFPNPILNYRIPDFLHKLSVTMSDGREYTAITRIPKLFEWEVPDSLTMELILDQYPNGVYKEEDKQTAQLPFSVSPDVGYVIRKANSEFDYFNFQVPEGGFLFDNRGDFLREGATYGLFDASSFPDKRIFTLGWDGNGSNPLRNSENWMLSLSQLNLPLSNFYYSLFCFVGTNPGGRWDKQDQDRLKALVERDTTFLFNISNILKVNGNGEILPENQADAIGVFGGYSAAYRRLTVIPQRSWDPDTLNWGNQKN